MNNYEAMVIIRPDLNENTRTEVFQQIEEQITKNQGEIQSSKVWAEKHRMTFKIRKFDEGLYYVINFLLAPAAVIKIKQAWKLNDNILRVLILR
ncbi:30S ribosomal protein S6 [Candidatus Omnitrophota bacterium]